MNKKDASFWPLRKVTGDDLDPESPWSEKGFQLIQFDTIPLEKINCIGPKKNKNE
jgi:hypothetical protein